MTEADKISNSQKKTGAFRTTGMPRYGQAVTEKDWLRPMRQDTTFISTSTGTTRTFLPGDIIDNTYQLWKLLGRGGMGIVFACKHTTLGTQYALKLLSDNELSEEIWKRFRAEAKALARLNHPSIVGIHNMGIDSGQFPYYVMDLLSGETLDKLVESDGPLPADQTLDYFIQVSDALSSAHSQGIIHRDIKPGNLMLVRNAQAQITAIKVVDFGIARLTHHEQDSQSQTKTGLVFGTPYYMSPEQCSGTRVDERSDIYSLGCTIFEALTGKPPFCGNNAFETFMMHHNDPPPALSAAAPSLDFPQALELAVGKMLAKKPEKRYQTMLQLQHDLERIKAGKPIMVQGMTTANITPIKPLARPQAKAQASRRFEPPEPAEPEKPQIPQKLQIPPPVKILLTASLVALITFAGIIYRSTSRRGLDLVRQPQPAPGSQIAATPDVSPPVGTAGSAKKTAPAADNHTDTVDPNGAESMGFGTPDQEGSAFSSAFESGVTGPFKRYKADITKVQPYLQDFVNASRQNGGHFWQDGSAPGFYFPQQFSIGAISINGNEAVLANGIVRARPGSEARLYLENSTCYCPAVLDLFGPEDLIGLHLAWPEPLRALSRIQHWKRLRDLSLFNPMIRPPANEVEWEQSPMDDQTISYLNRFTNLTGLGICGPNITAQAILKMPVLPRLEKLFFLRVKNMAVILPKVSQLDNLRELWLIDEGIGEEELELLTHTKNLMMLDITKNKIKPEWVKYFAKMRNLKHLAMDEGWPLEQQKTFQARLPHCQIDFIKKQVQKYWVIFPEHHKHHGHHDSVLELFVPH